MKKRLCYFFLFDGFADWEAALAIAGLNTYSDFEIKSFSVDGNPVKSMGNLTVIADIGLNEVMLHKSDLLILPGGNDWENGGNMMISEFVKEYFNSGKTIAAICAATTFLAKLGLYRSVKHTSNGLEYLRKIVPEYSDEQNFINEPCVSDKNLITANGAAMIEFAHKIFEYFQIMDGNNLDFWLNLYKSGGMKY